MHGYRSLHKTPARSGVFLPSSYRRLFERRPTERPVDFLPRVADARRAPARLVRLPVDRFVDFLLRDAVALRAPARLRRLAFRFCASVLPASDALWNGFHVFLCSFNSRAASLASMAGDDDPKRSIKMWEENKDASNVTRHARFSVRNAMRFFVTYKKEAEASS
jgi:hypothetical protein